MGVNSPWGETADTFHELHIALKFTLQSYFSVPPFVVIVLRGTTFNIHSYVTLLKIAVESVTLELCDSRDHFASSLLVKKMD